MFVSRDCLIRIYHFKVVCLATWYLNESEAGVDLVLKETLLILFFF